MYRNEGNEGDFQRILMDDADLTAVNGVDENGNTALLRAAETGSEIMVTQLLDRGSNVNALNNLNNSALVIAINAGM